MNWIDIIDKNYKEAQSTEDGTKFRFRRKDGAWQLYTPEVIEKAEEIVAETEEIVKEAEDIKPAPKKRRKKSKK